jgi:hypothetical protein
MLELKRDTVTWLRLHRSGAWYAATVLCPNPLGSSLRLVDRPGLADASCRRTAEPWIPGGLDLSGTKPTKIGESLPSSTPRSAPCGRSAPNNGTPCTSWPTGSSPATPVHCRSIVSA